MNKLNKKIIIIILTFLLTFSLIGCEFFSTYTNNTSRIATTNSLTTTNPTTNNKTVFNSSSTVTTNSTVAPTTVTTTAKPTTAKPTTTIVTTTKAPTTVTEPQIIDLSFYAFNDLHGKIDTIDPNISQIGEYLIDLKENDDNTIVIASGDMFQGTAMSNYYYGLILVEVLNEIGIDAFTIGNHEFDWGIEKIAAYSDGNADNGEADFPFLGANIKKVSTNKTLDFLLPYQIVEKDGVKIGIVGVIGDVINSISASRVQDIYFDNVVDCVKETAYELRVNQGCEIVVTSIHDYDSYVNDKIAKLQGDYQIDAIFNGHTHENITGYISRNTGVKVPYVQVNSSSSYLSNVNIKYDKTNGYIKAVSCNLISNDEYGDKNPEIDQIIDIFTNDVEYQKFISEEYVLTGTGLYRSDLAVYGATLIKEKTHADVGCTNGGGFRYTTFGDYPYNVSPNVMLTNSVIMELYPFDNQIKTSYLTGSQLISFYELVDNRVYDVVFSRNLEYKSGTLYIDDVEVVDDELYQIAAVDYIFDKTNYAFLSGTQIATTDIYMRDIILEDLRLHKTNGVKFYPNNAPLN